MTTTVYMTADKAWTTKRMVDTLNGISTALIGGNVFFATAEDAQQDIDNNVIVPTVLVRVTFEVVE